MYGCGSPGIIRCCCDESLEYLAFKPDGVYVDMTAGLGGHTAAIAERLETGFVIACDRDGESLELAQAEHAAVGPSRIRFHHGAFSTLSRGAERKRVDAVDGVLADLGVSRYQLSAAERGFSLMEDGPLDMRMDRSQGDDRGGSCE